MTDTAWLDADEQRAWVGLLAVGSMLDTALDAQLQRDCGISHATYMILSVLSGMPEQTMSMTTLANLTNSSQSRMSHAVARLEERGWVTRARAADSRRLVLASLTRAGQDVLSRAAPGHVATVRSLVFDALSPDQVAQLSAVNATIIAALAAAGVPYQGPLDLSIDG